MEWVHMITVEGSAIEISAETRAMLEVFREEYESEVGSFTVDGPLLAAFEKVYRFGVVNGMKRPSSAAVDESVKLRAKMDETMMTIERLALSLGRAQADVRAIPVSAAASGFVSGSCTGVLCHLLDCDEPAAAKVEETIFHDDPFQDRHNLTAYVCAGHFRTIMGGAGIDLTESMRVAKT